MLRKDRVDTVTKTNLFELFVSNEDIIALRLDDKFISKPLNENTEVKTLIAFLDEYTEEEVNEVLNKINYFDID